MRERQDAYARWKSPGQDLREEYLPLVYEQAQRILFRLPPGLLERDEVVSFGVIGMLEALERYDAGRGVPIEAYLRTQIRRRILDGLRSQDRLPRRLRERERRVREAYAQLEQQEGRSVSDDEVAASLGVTGSEFQDWLLDLSFTTLWSLELLGEEGVEPLDDDPSPEAAVEAGELHAQLRAAIERLPRREQEVLAAHYDMGYSMQEIAAAFELSDRYVAQLHARAVLRLRGSLSRYRAQMKGRDVR